MAERHGVGYFLFDANDVCAKLIVSVSVTPW
jgi:hypothetical protein